MYGVDLMTRSGGPPKRLGEVPDVVTGELLGRREVLRVALRCARVDPPHDVVELVVGERAIVLELLDAERPIDVPRRHLPRGDAALDRADPRPHLFIGDQRHRRDVARAMTRLALLLEDRRDVLRERGRGGVLPCRDRPGETEQADRYRDPGSRPPSKPCARHLELLSTNWQSWDARKPSKSDARLGQIAARPAPVSHREPTWNKTEFRRKTDVNPARARISVEARSTFRCPDVAGSFVPICRPPRPLCSGSRCRRSPWGPQDRDRPGDTRHTRRRAVRPARSPGRDSSPARL